MFADHGRPVTVPGLLVRPSMNRLRNNFGIGNGRWIECGPAPRHVERQPRKVDDAPITAVTTQIVRGAHEDAVDWTRLDAQRTKHALGIIDGEAGYLEAFTVFHPLFADVDAIDRASFRALIAGDARR